MTLKTAKVALISACVLGIFMLAIFAATRVNPQISGEVGDIANGDMAVADMSFFSADVINLDVNSTDDVFAVGSEINVNSASADHLVVAGGDVSVKSVALQDLFAAGGELDLESGEVADDIVVAGGDVIVRPSFGIGGSAVVAGGDARFEAAVPVDLRIGAASVYLNSAVGGDARLSGDEVTLGPEARIGGDLFYRTGNLIIDPGAVVTGRRIVMPPQEHSAFESWGRGAGELFAMLALAATLGFTLLVVVIAIAVPSLMRSSADFIRANPFKSLGLGLVVAVGIPVAIILLFTSVIGAPIAMLLGAICLAITPVAVAAMAFLLGMEIRKLLTKADDYPAAWSARLFWPALGAAVILLLGMIPILGLLVWLLAMLFGLGAVVSRGGKALAQNA